MAQKQPKEKKCRITEEQLEKRFNEADINGDGTLSADQITTLLQNIGFQDTYKGTIRKICRYLNKEKKLKQTKNEAPETNNTKKIKESQKQSQTPSKMNSEDESEMEQENGQRKQTYEEKKKRKEEQKKKEEEEAAITFDEFKRYFQILEKPIGKILYNTSLQRSVMIAQLCRQVNLKNMFHKDKGQKLKINFLVGQKKPEYNSNIQLKLSKEVKNKKNSDIFYIEISVKTNSNQSSSYVVQGLKSIYSMVIEMLSAQNQEYSQLPQIIKFEGTTQGPIAKLKISTQSEQIKKLITQALYTIDQILETQVTMFIRILYQFNFYLHEIKENPNTAIEDIFVKDANIKIQYSGSQFLDAVKEIALTKDLFELLRIDNDPFMLALLGFLSMQNGDFFMKFKNFERTQITQNSRDLTKELIGQLGMVKQIPPQVFDLRKVSQIVDGPIIITSQMENVKLSLNINIKDILKLPYFLDGPDEQAGYDSD